MNIRKPILLLAALSLPGLLIFPAFAQQPSLPLSDKYHQETNSSRLLRGIDAVVLTVTLASTYENGKPIPATKELQVDTEAIRAKWEKKLRAAGIKTLSAAEYARFAATVKKDSEAALIPPLHVSIVTGFNEKEKTDGHYWWSSTITLDQPMVPYRQLIQKEASAKPLEVYSFPAWQDGYGSSLMSSEKLADSIDQLLSGSVDKFIRAWRLANNKLSFDSFPKH